MKYTINIRRSAQKQLSKISKEDQSRIIAAIYSLTDNPRPQGCRKLYGRPAWRIRIGVYRVIYEIHDGHLHIIIITIKHRKDVY